MTGARAAGVAALAVLVALSTVAPAVAQTNGESGQVIGSPSIDVVASSPEVEPGTQTQLELTLSNRGSIDRGGPAQYEERVTTARGVIVTVDTGSGPIEVTSGSVGVGNLPTGTESVPPVDITVAESAKPGTYRVPVTVAYAYTRGVNYDVYGAEYNDFTEEETHYVTIRVRDQARFEVVEQSSTAQVGDRGTLSVTAENVGTRTARDASVVAESRSDEITFGTGSERSTASVGTWEPGERRTVDYTVSTADEATLRDYTVDLSVDYLDTDGIDRVSRTLNVGLRPVAEQSFSLTNVSAGLRVGEEGRITGTVVNEGPTTARSPVVVLSTNSPDVTVDSAEYAADTLDPGERARVDYSVTVSSAASPSAQQFEFTTRYRNSRNSVKTSDALETRAQIEPRRDRFVVETTTDGITAGQTKAVTVRITNNGDQPLTNVEAKAFVQSPLSSDNDEGIVPGRLEPGETATFAIALSAANGALPKEYPVSFDLQYEMPDGDTEISKTYTTAVRVTESEGGGFPVSLTAGALAVAAAVGVVGWRRRSG
ncbi:MAG: S-layer domain protein [uncultured archaeon A07HB70]|nr:MAG: S-layer domain protein [uncultured archaeon A07HB70]